MNVKCYNCPVEAVFEVVSGKWKLLILWRLSQGTYRFSELRKLVAGISEKMLTQNLKEFEKHGIVSRKVYSTIPPMVEYSLTDRGQSLKNALDLLQGWGEQHIEQIGALYKFKC